MDNGKLCTVQAQLQGLPVLFQSLTEKIMWKQQQLDDLAHRLLVNPKQGTEEVFHLVLISAIGESEALPMLSPNTEAVLVLGIELL